MHTHAVHRIAKAVRLAGGVSLRFNFRGVGLSDGTYDQGRGEADDAGAALAFLAGRYPRLPRALLRLLLRCLRGAGGGPARPGRRGAAAGRPGARRPIPDLPRDLEPLRALRLPVAVVQAERDQFGSPGQVRSALEGSVGPRRVAVVKHATHLFTEALDDLQLEAEAAVGWLLDAGARHAAR